MNDIEQLLGKANALHRRHHFINVNGEHGDTYLNLRVLHFPEYATILQTVSLALIERIIYTAALDLTLPMTIVGPGTMGAIIAHTAAVEYNKKYGTDFASLAISSHVGNGVAFDTSDSRTEELLQRPNIVYVDDVLATGSAFERCCSFIETVGKISAAGHIVNQNRLTASKLKVGCLVSLIQLHLLTYPAERCILCEQKRPIVTNLGYGKRYELKEPFYAGGFEEIKLT